MLSEEEKREMLKDARSAVRRKAFCQLRAKKDKVRLSLDEYIQFLNGIHNLFPTSPTFAKPIEKNMRL